MIESIPSNPPSLDSTLSTFCASPSNCAICSGPAAAQCDDAIISSFLERYADQLEVNCSLLEQSEISTLRADTVELHPAMLDYSIARDRFAVAAPSHRFKNGRWANDQEDADEEWEELNPGVPAPPWPTAESLFHSIHCLQYYYEKDTRFIPWNL